MVRSLPALSGLEMAGCVGAQDAIGQNMKKQPRHTGTRGRKYMFRLSLDYAKVW